MKRRWKKLFSIGAAIILILVIIFWELLSYGYMQAKGQVQILVGAQPVEAFLEDPNFPDSLKIKIKLIQEVRKFAIDSLGLKNSANYTTLYDQKGKDILWNLSAVKKYEMTAKEWGFPLLGTFSYKGFFDLEKAREEKSILDLQGYDTRIRPVGGWSTLGWFKDPILSNMLSRKEGQLAELIIHELTHATLYIKDSVAFNENLATFIGEKGAIKFISDYYGENSIQMKTYLQSFVHYENYANHMLLGYKSLDSLYKDSQYIKYDTTQKNILKKNLISSIISNLDTIQYSNKQLFKKFFAKQPPNNAYFMAFQRYRAKQGQFEGEFQDKFNNDIKSLIQWYAQEYPSL